MLLTFPHSAKSFKLAPVLRGVGAEHLLGDGLAVDDQLDGHFAFVADARAFDRSSSEIADFARFCA